MTGLEPSKDLLHRFRTDALASGLSPELIEGEIDQLDTLLGNRVFDAVCAHGLLMYLDDPARAITRLAKRVASAGLLSITFKNAHGLAMRPALRGDWTAAVSAFDTSQYVNELGVDARANRLEEIESHLAAAGLEVDTCGTGSGSSTTRSKQASIRPTMKCFNRSSKPRTPLGEPTPTAGSGRSSTSSPSGP